MSAEILDGKSLAQKIRREIGQAVAHRRAAGHSTPGLGVVLVGDDPASHVYVRNKHAACEQAGMHSENVTLPSSVTTEDLLETVDALNCREDIHGVLVQLPLPEQVDAEKVINRVAVHKDVDGFHAENVGRLALRQPGLRPCTPWGVIRLLEEAGEEFKGRHAVVVGASNIVGRPMALELLLKGATITVCHRFTRDLPEHVGRGEILVVATGKPGVVDPNWIRPGATVVDVGIHRNEHGQLHGDLDFEVASQRADYITPVPGGVGPMTVAMLLQNTLEAARMADDAIARGAWPPGPYTAGSSC